MKKSSSGNTGKVIRFCKKRITAFVRHLNNAALSGYVSDIHSTRVEMKKMLTIIELLKDLYQEKSVLNSEKKQLKKLFRRMGKLREVQVNLKILSNASSSDSGILDFRYYLEQREKKCLRNFILEADSFDREACDKIISRIKKIFNGVDKNQFVKHSGKYIRKRIEKIRDLTPGMQDISNAHLVRKNLKSIVVVQTMICLLDPDKETFEYLAELNRNEKIIGAWHDKMVFLNSLETYLHKIGGQPDQILMPFYNLKSRITKECEEIFRQFSEVWPL